jgi:hypothetical protein
MASLLETGWNRAGFAVCQSPRINRLVRARVPKATGMTPCSTTQF